MEEMMQALDEESERKRGESPAPQQTRWGANIRAALFETASRVTGAVASAQELLRDPSLRRSDRKLAGRCTLKIHDGDGQIGSIDRDAIVGEMANTGTCRKGAAFIVSRAQEGLQAIGKQLSSSFNKQQLAVRAFKNKSVMY